MCSLVKRYIKEEKNAIRKIQKAKDMGYEVTMYIPTEDIVQKRLNAE